MPTLTGKTIGQLNFLSGVTSDTLIPVELSGSTYHINFSSTTNANQYLNAGNSNTDITINWALANVQEINLNDDPTISFTNSVPGKRQTLLLKQELPGQRTITWPGGTIWNNDIAPTMQNLPFSGGGDIDTSFVIGTGFSVLGGTPVTIQLQPDGKILVGGGFTVYSGASRNYIIRLNTDGSIDNSFVIDTGFSNEVKTIKLQPDGKILVGGTFTSYSGVSKNYIIRLNTDGSIDNSFVIGSGFNNWVYDIQLQPDGKILVGGFFTSYSGVSRNRIIRLNTDGSIDTSFVIGTGFNTIVETIQLQPDGKILVGGQFATYSGVSSNRIIRLNTDGSIDASFVIGSGFNGTIQPIQLQTDGKILVGGLFTSYSGVSSGRVIRLNTDGSVDTGFVIGTGFNNSVYSIQLQPDSKILIGGTFTSYSGVSRNRIIRLNTDGSIDTSFVIGTGFSGIPYISLQSDGKILVGGTFTSYNGSLYNRIIRLDGYDSQTKYNVVNIDYNGTYYIGSF
jgi:uncharacterized delta-60 repeat protein